MYQAQMLSSLVEGLRQSVQPVLCGALFVLSVVVPAMTALGASDKEQTPSLLIGAATGNITPWLGVSMAGGMTDRVATYIHDDLLIRCIVLDNGKTRQVIATCDSCMIPRDILDEAKRIAHEQTGIPMENMLIAATHTHTAPTARPAFQSKPDKDYLHFVTVRIADTIRRAISNLAPAQIGWGVGSEPEQVFNRRWYMKPGTIPPDPFGWGTDQVKMNPPRSSPDLVKPAGPIDPEIPVIAMRTRDGRPLALLANYALHYVGGTAPGHVSADYFGVFADRIGQMLDADHLHPPFVAMMTNGTSGNINNINFREPAKRQPPYEQMTIVANAAAAEAFRVLQTIEYRDHLPLATREKKIRLGVRRPDARQIERAREIIAGIEGPQARTLEQIYALETIHLSEYPETVELILQAIRIGDLAILAVPCEVFVEIGLELKAKSPFKPTFVVELANGYSGYLPTVEQHKLGGYETWPAKSSYLEVEAAPKIVEALLECVNDLQ